MRCELAAGKSLTSNPNENLHITCGAGFIGSNLIQHVIDQPEIHQLVNLDCLTYAVRH